MKWRLDGQNPQRGGDVGGDIQAADSWCVRFVGDPREMRDFTHPFRAQQAQPGVERLVGKQLHSVVTVYTYAASKSWETVLRGPWHVATQAEMTVCTDPNRPGDTEVWNGGKYIDDRRAYDDLDKAERAARDLADRYVHDRRPPVAWDGRAEWER